MSIYKDIQINNTKILFLIPQGNATERSLTLPLHVITKDTLCTLMERLTGRATRIRDYLLNNSMQRNFLGVICGTLETIRFALTTYSIIVVYGVGDVVGLNDFRDDVGVDGLVRFIVYKRTAE